MKCSNKEHNKDKVCQKNSRKHQHEEMQMDYKRKSEGEY